MLRKTAILFLAFILLFLTACNDKAQQSRATAKQLPLLVGPEDTVTLRANDFASGPVIMGSIQAEQKATLSAEIASIAKRVLKENGQPVAKGELLIVLDDTAIKESVMSAQASERDALHSVDQAARQLKRLQALRQKGMASLQSLDEAEGKYKQAQSELAAAKTRRSQAQQQMARTEIRAPFKGLIAKRQVASGDTVQVGKELIEVIDPTSMRFEGSVSADVIDQLHTGQRVALRVNGYPNQVFNGAVKRISPKANAISRQVDVIVDFSDEVKPQIAGLYAEGHIETRRSKTLLIPDSAIVRAGDKTYAWQVMNASIQKVAITLGSRDIYTGDYVIKAGLNDSDVILRHPTTTLVDHQPIDVHK